LAAVPSIGRATGVEFPAAAPAAAAHGLYDRHYARVLGFCRNRLRTREEAEDAAQTTFCYALGALRRGVVPATESAWLLKIARNVCLNRWAANRRRNLVEVSRDPQVLQEVAPSREAADGERLALQDALEQLTELQRRAIVLREWQGLSYGEIAEELGLSRAAVETLIFRARRSLARHLRGDRRLGSRLDLGSILATLKSLLSGGGAAVKIVAAAAALVAAGAIAEPRIQHRSSPASRPTISVPRSSPIAQPPRDAVASRGKAMPSARVAPVASASPGRAASPGSSPPAGAASRPAPGGEAPANTPGASAPPAPGSPPPAAEPPPATPAAPAAPAAPAVPSPSAPPLPATSAPAPPAVPNAPALPPLPPAPALPVPVPTAPALPPPPVAPPPVHVALP